MTDVQQARTVLRDLLITYIVRMVHILTTQEPAHVISVLKVITVSEDLWLIPVPLVSLTGIVLHEHYLSLKILVVRDVMTFIGTTYHKTIQYSMLQATTVLMELVKIYRCAQLEPTIL